MIYSLQFGDILPYWDVLAWGLLFTVVLTLVSAGGVAVGSGTAARSGGGSPDRAGLRRADPQYRAALLHFLRSAGRRLN